MWILWLSLAPAMLACLLFCLSCWFVEAMKSEIRIPHRNSSMFQAFEELGRVRSVEMRGGECAHNIEARIVTEDTKQGDSVSVNGVV